jgi:TRAP-type mannitol/chloroaromatic compound transport system permease small subunit
VRTLVARCSVIVDRINQQLAGIIRWLALFMVLATVTIVVLRYVFSIGAIPLQESVMYMHGMLFLIGIPYGLKQDTHVRVDIIYSRLSARDKSRVDIAGHLLFLLPVSAFILITSLPYVAASWRVLEGSSEVGGIPGVFLLKTLIPVMASLLFLQGLSEIVKRLSTAGIRE